MLWNIGTSIASLSFEFAYGGVNANLQSSKGQYAKRIAPNACCIVQVKVVTNK
jgi:hypothetical protein